MSLAEIKAEIAKLSPDERAQLRRELTPTVEIDDPAYWAEIDRRHAEMEQGVNVVTKEQMYARLRAAGLDI